MKKVLVTGAGGFIGSHLIELLILNNYNVKAFVRYNSKNNWGWIENLKLRNEIEIITGDIRDYDSVRNAIRSCSSVFHLASLIGIPYSYVSPKAYIETNLIGTYNILEASKEFLIDQVIITSTSETYGSAKYVPIDEKHEVNGQSPYSATKIAADQLARSYYSSFDLPVKIVRPFNTYGPRQSARAIIPTIISQILNGDTNIKLGNLFTIRDLTFVKDTCFGFLKIWESDKLIGEATNIGFGQGISVEELVNLISKIMNKKVYIETDSLRIRPVKSEVNKLICDNTKLLTNTDWKPAYTLEEGIKETIDFIKVNLNHYKSGLYNI